jgi:hypothetical protein
LNSLELDLDLWYLLLELALRPLLELDPLPLLELKLDPHDLSELEKRMRIKVELALHPLQCSSSLCIHCQCSSSLCIRCSTFIRTRCSSSLSCGFAFA